MTIEDVINMDLCTGWKENKNFSKISWYPYATCYKIGGKKRMFHFITGEGKRIVEIQIQLDSYTSGYYKKLSTAIGKKYKKVFDIDIENRMNWFLGNELTCFHENKIALRESGKVVYLFYTEKPYKVCIEFAPPKDVSSDDF